MTSIWKATSFNDEKHQKEGWKFKYRNEKVCAFQKEGEKVWIEFIESEFGKPKEILRSFDFTVTKMAYYKEPKYEEKEDDYFPFSSASIVAYEYKLLYHEKFFEHLHNIKDLFYPTVLSETRDYMIRLSKTKLEKKNMKLNNIRIFYNIASIK